MKYILTTVLLFVAATSLSAQSLEDDYNSLARFDGGEKFKIGTVFTRLFSGNKVKTVKTMEYEGSRRTPEVICAIDSLVGSLVDSTSYVRDNSGDSESFIFMNPKGKDIEMLIIETDKAETSVVFMKCSQAYVKKFLNEDRNKSDKE